MAARHRSRNRTATNRAVVPQRGVAVSPSHDARTPRFTTLLATLRRGVVERVTAVDVVTLVYIAFATAAVLAFSGHDHAGWNLLLTAHGLIVVLVLIAPAARQAGSAGQFLGDWYPMLLLGGLYAEVGVLNVDLAYQHDLVVQRLGLWLSGRRAAARRTIFAVMITFYLCYVVFLFFPVAGPRYAFDLAHNRATGVWPARATQWLLDRGDSWGAAFPSSHVAAAVVAAVCALRYWRRLGLVLAPFTIGLVLSVVYGQFHYAVDAVAGLIVAGAVLASHAIYYATAPAAAPAALAERGLETGRA